MLDAARPHLLRIIGPGTLGLLVPRRAAQRQPRPGPAGAGRPRAARRSPAAIATALIDWAADRGIGFSQRRRARRHGRRRRRRLPRPAGEDGATRAILLYLETVPDARKFLSAARAAARLKPVIALKAGRSPAAAAAAATHTGALSGADAVVDAALRRAGILRVRGLAEMFAAAETVARFRPLQPAPGSRSSTNGGGAGVLAVDGVAEVGGDLAALAPETIAASTRPARRAGAAATRVDIGADAAPERYAAALDALAADHGVDALLVDELPERARPTRSRRREAVGRTRRAAA